MNKCATNIIYINQPLWIRILNLFKFKSNDISEIQLDENSWHNNEDEFTWSYPNAAIILRNINKLCLVLNCPIGREVVIKSKNFNIKRTQKKDQMYTFIINCKCLNEVFINTTPFFPEGDNRQLGLCFYNITDSI